MIEFIKNKWRSERRIKVISVILLLFLLLSVYLMYIVGIDPNTAGTVISGDSKTEDTIAANDSAVIVFVVTQHFWIGGFASSADLTYFLSNTTVSNISDTSGVAPITNGTSSKTTLNGPEKGKFWLLLWNNNTETVTYRHEVREYTQSEFNGILLFTLGSLIRKYTLYAMIFYLLIAIFIPWFRQRNKTKNQQSPMPMQSIGQSRFCSNCGKPVNSKFCQNCGYEVGN